MDLSTPPAQPRLPVAGRAAIAAGALIAILLILLLFDVDDAVSPLLERVDTLGWAAPPLFILLHAVAIVGLLPGVLFPLGAGFLFGALPGTLYSVAGKILGSAIAFLLARYVLSQKNLPERARRFGRRHPKLRQLEKRLPEGGWRNVLLIRLVPVIPFKISNYFFGWTRFSLRDFLVGTFLGAIPFSWINAYLGSVGADFASLGSRATPRSTIEWTLFLGGATLAVAAAIAIALIAVRILREADDGEPPGPPRPAGA